jgi:hypothetical protein
VKTRGGEILFEKKRLYGIMLPERHATPPDETAELKNKGVPETGRACYG